MLNQHQFSGIGDYCDRCREHRDDIVHSVAEDKHYRHSVFVPASETKSGFWGATAFFVLTFVATTATIYELCVNHWDRATFFLLATLEFLRVWGKYESRRE